jgi:hypothetical protein
MLSQSLIGMIGIEDIGKPPRVGLFGYSILRGWVRAQENQLVIFSGMSQAKQRTNYSTHARELQAAFFEVATLFTKSRAL